MLTSLKINHELYQLEIEPSYTLLDVLREKLGFTGTKKGCDQGECGACTVMIDGMLANSCLVLAVEVQDSEIITVEGLSEDGKLNELQEAFITHGAIQCGYCTPGMLLTSKFLLHEKPNPTKEEIIKAISGNICRCTGYVKIIEAIQAVTEKYTA